jgi:hypothetical protein
MRPGNGFTCERWVSEYNPPEGIRRAPSRRAAQVVDELAVESLHASAISLCVWRVRGDTLHCVDSDAPRWALEQSNRVGLSSHSNVRMIPSPGNLPRGSI